jgi:hypothetical protein
MVIFIFIKNESKLRLCGQLSKYIGRLDAVPTQTAKEGRTTLHLYSPDTNSLNQPRFKIKKRRTVRDILRPFEKGRRKMQRSSAHW